MILIADGGSTKVDWCLIDKNGLVKQVFTKGANPFFRTTEDIAQELSTELLHIVEAYKIKKVYFFGAGCAFPEKNEVVEKAICNCFPNAQIKVDSDLLGAAIGLCGDKAGIACIIGTGSNSCFFDGAKIVDNVSPLGYVLGDEGSGAVLGRLFIGNCLKNQFGKGVKEKFFDYLGQSQAELMECIYRKPLANRYLASVSPFVKQNLSDPTVYQLVYTAFQDFFKKNVMQYDYKSNSVSITGSIAYHYQDVIKEVAKDLGIQLAIINQTPMGGLIEFYKNKVTKNIIV